MGVETEDLRATRILIAEDDPAVSAVLERGLTREGSVTVVHDGREALQQAKSGDFDLLVLDLGLPGMDGREVLRELRNHGSRIPVVIVSGQPSAAESLARLEQGADDYIAKPFRIAELVARVQALLRGRPSGERPSN